MNKSRKSFVNVILGVMTCLLLVGLATPSMSKNTDPLLSAAMTSVDRGAIATSPSVTPLTDAIAQRLAFHLESAETALLAQVESIPAPTEPTPTPTETTPATPAPSVTLTRYTAVMSGSEVIPNAASTYAFGAAGAALIGNRFVVRGDFSGLTSALRDYATDPLNPPNPNITSGVHIHRGEATKNGPFQYALEVQPGANSESGRFLGEYTLTDEQLQALSNGTLYADLHTKQNRGGELRGIFKAI